MCFTKDTLRFIDYQRPLVKLYGMILYLVDQGHLFLAPVSLDSNKNNTIFAPIIFFHILGFKLINTRQRVRLDIMFLRSNISVIYRKKYHLPVKWFPKRARFISNISRAF